MITVYTTPSCKYCKDVKNFLTEHKFEFVEKDVVADAAAKEEMIAISGRTSVPLTVIDNHDAVLGFDEKILKDLLKIED